MSRSDRPNPGNARDFTKRDEIRGTTESPVSQEHYDRFGDQTVDAVAKAQGLRPGWSN